MISVVSCGLDDKLRQLLIKVASQYNDLEKPREVQGVGHGTQTCAYELHVPIGLQESGGEIFEEVYQAPCIPGSAVPGLVGIRSLRRNDALIRCKTEELWFLVPGGAKIEASPGSRHHQMRMPTSGHWMLKTNNFTEEPTSSGMVVDSSKVSKEEERDADEKQPSHIDSERHPPAATREVTQGQSSGSASASVPSFSQD